MPKNTGMGGNKRKKGKKVAVEARELVYKGEMEEYGQVTRMLGDSRLEIQCVDGVKRIGHIRGKMKKRNWIANGDLVLVSLREYENDKCDVIDKYDEDEVRKLKKAGEIPESITLPEDNKDKSEDPYGDIVFEDEGNEVPKQRYVEDLPPSDDEDEKDNDVNVDDI